MSRTSCKHLGLTSGSPQSPTLWSASKPTVDPCPLWLQLPVHQNILKNMRGHQIILRIAKNILAANLSQSSSFSPWKCKASVKLTYGVNYVLKSPPYAEIQDQRRPPYFQYSVLYAQTQTPRRPLQWQNPAHVSISPAYLWRNCVCACARPRVCRSVTCSYWTSCIGQPIIRVPQVHEWQVSHVAISGFWPLIAVEVWKINRSIVHRIQDQDQDSLLVKRRNDNHSPGLVIRELVPSSHQRSELCTQSSASSADEIRESGRAFQSLIVWGKNYLYKHLYCPYKGLGPQQPIKHTAKTLIWLDRCPDWSESSLCA